MRKIFSLLTILILIFSCPVNLNAEEVENNLETQKIIGGLYSLVSAVELNARAKVDVNSVVRFFEKIPAGWQNIVKIENHKNSIWVGVAVDKNSKARNYLRTNASALGIMDSPGGSAWFSGDFAWLKAGDTAKKKVKSINFSAAEGDGTIFFKSEGHNSWWAAYPSFTSRAKREILEKHGVENSPELHAPEEEKLKERTSIYEDVKPSSVRVPDKIHMGTQKSSLDMSVEVGDVIFNPIPNVHR